MGRLLMRITLLNGNLARILYLRFRAARTQGPTKIMIDIVSREARAWELQLLETPGGLRESTAYNNYASGQTPGGLDSIATRAWEPNIQAQ